ncbi:hypothetical protein SMACR_06351 [Sordaria macrospora]|uniref:Homoserine dehydrogenase n=1 Tax=Sordaria macrospora TaxID=5147 RepID=A0A8S8ZYU5_SORMA|nr:hypothetical protein SMACR_06351 [Sordaria macrospora]
MASARQVNIAIIGAGGVGKCFLSQLESLAARRQNKQKLVLTYIATSKKAVYSDSYSPIALDSVVSTLSSSSQAPLALPKLVDYLAASGTKTVLVDNTSSQDIADAYPSFLRRGISIVTPNKKAFSGSYKLWQDIFAAKEEGGALLYHEASCGAGLPVISTIKDLVETGDEVTKIEGVFSGTMSFLFNSFAPTSGSGGGKWSAEVAKAKELGYTEPDPRDDLNGLDVARKLTILARYAGLEVESPTSFPVQSLIPKELEWRRSRPRPRRRARLSASSAASTWPASRSRSVSRSSTSLTPLLRSRAVTTSLASTLSGMEATPSLSRAPAPEVMLPPWVSPAISSRCLLSYKPALIP